MSFTTSYSHGALDVKSNKLNCSIMLGRSRREEWMMISCHSNQQHWCDLFWHYTLCSSNRWWLWDDVNTEVNVMIIHLNIYMIFDQDFQVIEHVMFKGMLNEHKESECNLIYLVFTINVVNVFHNFLRCHRNDDYFVCECTNVFRHRISRLYNCQISSLILLMIIMSVITDTKMRSKFNHTDNETVFGRKWSLWEQNDTWHHPLNEELLSRPQAEEGTH
jgi:hypothetical protein